MIKKRLRGVWDLRYLLIFIFVIILIGIVFAAAPDQPTLISPANGSTGIALSPVLTITVTDSDADAMNVTFWNQIKSIATGSSHSCGLLSNGSAMCWGYNNNEQIGDGTNTQRENPVFVNTTESFVSIDCGSYHTCGLLSNGSAMCWGMSGNGQIGDGTTDQRNKPVFVNTTESFVSIGLGGSHTCGVLNNGSAMCWGYNSHGQIGNGSSGGNILNPVFVNTTESFVSIGLGGSHTCGVLNNGSAMCWGMSSNGQIGNGSSGGNILNPVFVNSTEIFVSITAGESHTCGVLENGSAMCWGYNGNGRIGDGTTNQRNNPVFVNTTESFVSITAGSGHTCGVLNNGSAMCWGYNGDGQIGNGSSGGSILNPVFVNTTESFVSITGDYRHTCGLLSNGSAMCWGYNGNGRIGDGTTDQRNNPVFVNTTESFVSIGLGGSHTCGVLNNGSAMCWGMSSNGQIGNGSSGGNILNPVFVNSTEIFVSITAGESHTCGVLENGSAMCWGYNGNGRIGDGTTDQRNNPVFVNTTETMESPVIGNDTNVADGFDATTTWADLNEGRTYLWSTTVFDGDSIANSPIWKFTTVVVDATCTESWTCTEWSTCSGGTQTKTCTDSNSCGTTVNKPAESQTCTVGGGGGITAGQPTESHSWTEITPDQPAEMTIDDPEIDLTKITITTTETVLDASLTVTKIDVLPQADLEIGLVSGSSYQAFKIDTTGITDENIEEAIIEFKVEKSWVEGEEGIAEDISLYRKRDKGNQWDTLSTTFVSEDENYYYFSATSPGFSIFVVVIDLSVCNNNGICETEIGEDETNCPNDCVAEKKGFFEMIKSYFWTGIVFVLVVVMGLVILFIRSKKGKQIKRLKQMMEYKRKK